MKVLHMNPFIESIQYILEQFQLSCEIGKPVLRDAPFSGKDILTVVGVTGEIRGQIYLGIPMGSALKIISKMMGGVEVLDFDSMAQSAISELSNMICGHAMTLFSKEGIILDITPPTVVLGKGIEVAAIKVQVLAIPVLIEGMEPLEMDLLLEEKK